MKETYTFKATAEATDYQRICRENPLARFIIVKSEDMQPLTFVRFSSAEHAKLRSFAGKSATARIVVDTGRAYLIFDGDHSNILAPKLLTTVEAYR